MKELANMVNDCHVQVGSNCCCPDVGALMDNKERVVSYEALFKDEISAKVALKDLINKARGIESDPCQISSRISKSTNGYRLYADFSFCCQAEMLIFQLRLR